MFRKKCLTRMWLLGGSCIIGAGLLSACMNSASPEVNETGMGAGGNHPAMTPAASANSKPVPSAAEPSEGGGGNPENTQPALSSSAFPYTAQTLASGLNVPWEMAFAPDGRIFFTERPGTLRVFEEGELRKNPLLELPAPFISEGEGGLLGFALDPAFEDNGFAYAYHSYRSDSGGVENRVLRLSISGSKAEIDKVLLDGIPGDANHNGGRIKFGPDGYLYITTGERYEPELAQDQESLGGKILRISKDGSIPADNPFLDSLVYSRGHRNPQGLAWQPESGVLYSSEHGQSSHDEINIIEPGSNYGWPLIEGDEAGTGRGEQMKLPLLHSGEETWAPSGMAFITQGPWSGELLVANLAGQQLLHVSPGTGDKKPSAEALFQGKWGRIRNVAEGPDGTLYVMTNNRDGRGSPGTADDLLIALKPNWK
ncbi:PQQ-dependent sugar dehydrogenase [Paenibacillus sonchi]|uniref:PQQ-dependent sugar dehydrogenase n=1 Tax=Paenibacillus sonchi TaxID=373687 RepID=UPI001E4B4C96|nr:PQQ-dependent sugar dehydrogenase [Paenibacillus sonchi]